MATPDLRTLPSVPLPDTLDPPSPVIIERMQPEIDAGRYPIKRVQGDILEVTADIFTDDHARTGASALRIEHGSAAPSEWGRGLDLRPGPVRNAGRCRHAEEAPQVD